MKQKQKSIAIIICYIGKLPWYFDYFAQSCKYNPSIDFIIVTDDTGYSKPSSTNVRFIYKTLSEINHIAKEKLELPVQITTGYKLCDFKPTYGILFSELLKGYDFWGHGDIDVIYGNIRKFITKKVLQKNDLVSVRHDYVTGHFTLFRNTRKMNELFKLSKDFRKVLTSERNFCFDETNYTFEYFTLGISYENIPSEVESMTHLVRKLERERYLVAYFDFHIIEGTPGKLNWSKGKLIYRNKYEVMMYHLIKLKSVFLSKKKYVGETFRISPTRIY